MITELYKDVETLEAIKESLDKANTIHAIGFPKHLISQMIKEKNQEISKIQDEHNRRSLEDLLGRKI